MHKRIDKDTTNLKTLFGLRKTIKVNIKSVRSVIKLEFLNNNFILDIK